LDSPFPFSLRRLGGNQGDTVKAVFVEESTDAICVDADRPETGFPAKLAPSAGASLTLRGNGGEAIDQLFPEILLLVSGQGLACLGFFFQEASGEVLLVARLTPDQICVPLLSGMPIDLLLEFLDGGAVVAVGEFLAGYIISTSKRSSCSVGVSWMFFFSAMTNIMKLCPP